MQVFKKTLPQCKIKVIFQSKKRLSNLFRFKDSIPKELCSYFVYIFCVVIAALLITVKLNTTSILGLENI